MAGSLITFCFEVLPPHLAPYRGMLFPSPAADLIGLRILPPFFFVVVT
jgi:hypothetical protein